MLRRPKTLPGDASVQVVREQLANPSVQMVLLADGPTFRAAIASIPDEALPDEAALLYAEPSPETIDPDEPAEDAFARAVDSQHRRVIVLDDEERLLGLICLNKKRTGVCSAKQTEES
jgi:CBS domain-containing protein